MIMKKRILNLAFLLIILICALELKSKVIEVCPTCPIRNLEDASINVQPGDTILMRSGVYTTSSYISNLRGTNEKWITLTAKDNEEVIFRGQSTAMQLSDPAYLRILKLNFESQTANGVNIDDGGTYETPANNIIIEYCEWRSMNATGNNDMLKLSGVDHFIIRNCKFSNGSPGGSGIDMVGCHYGVIENCIFEEQGSNSIQNKGGTSGITIQKNLFMNGGLRALNIGGSTGLEFFRPQGAKYEAKEIFVYSNIFVGSQAPIAFVGSINCNVINNTIYLPTKWAIRILQENTNEGFAKCSNNNFVNNVVYVNNSASNPTINIGSNTSPETFYFANNLWCNRDNTNWAGPNLPVLEINGIKNIDPMISEDSKKGIVINKSSPVNGKGSEVEFPKEDFEGNIFNSPRSIGAIEVNPRTNSIIDKLSNLIIYPNPTTSQIFIELPIYYKNYVRDFINIKIYDITGVCVYSSNEAIKSNLISIDLTHFQTGIYFLIIDSKFIKFSIER